MVGATPVVNDHRLPTHLGAYLPFEYEITHAVTPGDNVLAVALDSRWTNVPPEGSPRGPRSIDYLEPGGIPRPVTLRVVPQTFISDVSARSSNVMDAARRLDVTCSIDAAVPSSRPLSIFSNCLIEGRKTVSRSFSADRSRDRLVMTADAAEIRGDGADAVRLEFKAADRFGALRPFTGGTVQFHISGPGELVGDNPFDLEPTGGAGAVWLRAMRCTGGPIRVTAIHSTLGTASVRIDVLRAGC